MAAAFKSVNPANPGRHNGAMSSPGTPRSGTAQISPALSHTQPDRMDESKTPTQPSFPSSAMSAQRPLPADAFPPAMSDAERVPGSNTSQPSTSSPTLDPMDESEGEDDGSDGESVNADGSRSGKKKKSQRFFCTEYPPCNLSFTRSEHLARHIRKHTGERPFQCHCSRRFSRLDNLRQHAQTVHINEDIPPESLAASNTRFPRQRPFRATDQVRQAGNRARAATSGSAGGPARGHSKSLSTSSVNSISSVASTYSQRRPPPLVMASNAGPRASLDSYRSTAGDSTFSSHRHPSPSDFGTPTSATFSTGQSSPRWTSVASPPSHSRSQSMYSQGTRTPGRRLSVPSGTNPLLSPGGFRHGYGHGSVSSLHGSVYSYNSSQIASPTYGAFERGAGQESMDEAWRRRTWHPDSRTLSGHPGQYNAVHQHSTTPNPPPPMTQPTQPQPGLRLPGIKSLLMESPVTPPERAPSPMMVDSEPVAHRPTLQPVGMETDERRNLNMYDAGLYRGLNRLDIGHNTPPRDSAGSWASEANRAVMAQAERVRANPPTVRFEDQQPPSAQGGYGGHTGRSLHHQTMSAPSIATTRENRRRGWYNGSVVVQRDAPQAPADPRVAHVDRMIHPNINSTFGFPNKEPPKQQPPQQGQAEQPREGSSLSTLAELAIGGHERERGPTAKAY